MTTSPLKRAPSSESGGSDYRRWVGWEGDYKDYNERSVREVVTAVVERRLFLEKRLIMNIFLAKIAIKDRIVFSFLFKKN